MPLPADRLPPDLRSLTARVAALERALAEARSAPRLSHAVLADGAITVVDGSGAALAALTSAGGIRGVPGLVAYDPANPYWAMLAAGARLEWGRTDAGYTGPALWHTTGAGAADPSTLTAGSGYVSGARQALLRLVGPNGTTGPYVEVASESGTCDQRVSGTLTAGNIAYGTTTVTVTTANTPASASVSGLNISGTTFRGWASASTTAPGTTPGTSGVTGVSVTGATSTGLTVWANRQAAASVTVHWLVIGQ